MIDVYESIFLAQFGDCVSATTSRRVRFRQAHPRHNSVFATHFQFG